MANPVSKRPNGNLELSGGKWVEGWVSVGVGDRRQRSVWTGQQDNTGEYDQILHAT